MIAFNCLVLFGLLIHLVSSDVSLTIGSNQQNGRSEQAVRSNYEAPRGYEYSGSYSTVAPENKAQYVGSYSTVAPESKAQYVAYSNGANENKAQYVGSYSTVAPENKAQYVAYSNGAPENKAQYVGSYSTVAPENKAQYVGSYSTVAPESKAQYVAYSNGAPDNKAQYVGSYSGASDNKAQYYSAAAPENKAQYVASYSGADNNAQYVGSYSTVAPENKAQYVASYSAGSDNKAQYYSAAAPENKAQYVASYSGGADNKAQYDASYSGGSDNKAQYYSAVAPENKAQYVASYSGGADNKAEYDASYSGGSDNKAQYYSAVAPENKAQYVASYSGGADNKAQYVGSYSGGADKKAQYYSAVAPENKAQYVASYSGGADNKAQYVGSYSGGSDKKAQYYSAVAPENKAQYVASYSGGSDNKAQYDASYLGGAENKAQYVSASSPSSYAPNPSGQVSSERNYYSAKQEYNPQYQNDRGVLLISKELQVPFVESKKNDEKSDGCDETTDSKANQQVQGEENFRNDQSGSDENDGANADDAHEPPQPVYKSSKYEVRRPGIRKEFYDIEEKVFIKPAGSAIFELQHDKPHSSAIVSKHISQKQSYPQAYPQTYPQSYPQTYPQSYPEYSDGSSQYYPQQPQYANHAYNPVIIQSVPSTGYDYNPQSPRRTHVTYPNYNPVYPSTPEYAPPVPGSYLPPVASGYIPPAAGGYLPPCDDTPDTKPYPPPSQHELNEEYDENDKHDYDSDAAFITPITEDNQETGDIKYASSKPNSNREREYYRKPQSSVYNPESRIDRLQVEYKNERGDLAQLKANQYPQQFHQEYVPTVTVDRSRVQIRPNGAPPAKYTQDKASSQVEIENSQRLLDLYSANGDVTEIGFGESGKTQQYTAPNSKARVVSVTPAPEYSNYVDEQSKSRRVVLTKPLYTVQQVEVREHNHRLVEDVDHDGIEPKVSEFAKLRLIGNAFGQSSSSSSRKVDINAEAEYVTPVPQEFAHLRAGSPVPETLQN